MANPSWYEGSDDAGPDVQAAYPGLVTPIPLPIGTLTTAMTVIGGQARIIGFGLHETTGAATATVDLFSGSGVGGILLTRVNLGANESTREWWPLQGMRVNGLFLNVVAGSVGGSVWVVPE